MQVGQKAQAPPGLVDGLDSSAKAQAVPFSLEALSSCPYILVNYM
jgi:hypothetical protein